MHIVYEIERLSTSGGIERILTEKANYMADVWGWEVTIIVLLENRCSSFFPLSPKVNTIYLGINSRGLKMCAIALWKLDRTINKIKPDIYITVQTIGALSCLIRTHRTPTIYEAHGIRPCMPHQYAMTIAEKHADVVVVLTSRNAERYSKAKRTEIIPNFTDIIAPRVPDYESKHCIAVGRLDFEKNYQRMIDIWSKIHKSFPDWILDIYGEGPQEKELQDIIDSNNLTDNVILHGKVTDIANAYVTGSMYLMTSRFEGFGLALAEAAACGLPAISIDCPDGPKDIICNNKTGFLVPDDDDMIVSAIKNLITDEKLRRQMGAESIKLSKRFNRDAIMDSWHSLFMSLT